MKGDDYDIQTYFSSSRARGFLYGTVLYVAQEHEDELKVKECA